MRQASGGVPVGWGLVGLLVGVAAFVGLWLVIYLSLTRSRGVVHRRRRTAAATTRLLADQLARGQIGDLEYRRVALRLEDRPGGAGRRRVAHRGSRRR